MSLVAGLLCRHLQLSHSLCMVLGLALVGIWHPRPGRRSRLLAAMALAMTVGALRAATDHSLGSHLPHGSAAFEGEVLEAPRAWGTSQVFFFTVLRVKGVALESPPTVLVRWSKPEDVVAPGERWEFFGRFGPGEPAEYPGGFSQSFWLWTQRAEGMLTVGRFDQARFVGPPRGWGPAALAARLRVVMLTRLGQVEPPLARALVCGVVFGDTQALPKDTQAQFRRTGTSHLLAASGMNVALLLGLLTAAARCLGFGPWRIAPALIPVAVGYAFLAGCAPSINRAAAAATVALLAAWLGRSSSSWNSLCLSVWILLLWEPRQIFDAGFQLSVLAVVGLIAGPTLDENAPGWKKSAVMTISACLLTLPIMWSMFGELSLTLLPANLILGPLVELLFPLGLLLSVFPLAPLAWLVGLVARASLYLVARLSELADPIPLAQPGWASLALLGLAVAVWVGVWTRWRWSALVIAGIALLHGHDCALRAPAGPGELILRQIGTSKPFYWISCAGEEVLLLAGDWQEGKARAMLLDRGCLRQPRVRVLPPGQAFELGWGAFQWGKVSPLLPKAPYVEVRTTGSRYVVSVWRPEDS